MSPPSLTKRKIPPPQIPDLKSKHSTAVLLLLPGWSADENREKRALETSRNPTFKAGFLPPPELQPAAQNLSVHLLSEATVSDVEQNMQARRGELRAPWGSAASQIYAGCLACHLLPLPQRASFLLLFRTPRPFILAGWGGCPAESPRMWASQQISVVGLEVFQSGKTQGPRDFWLKLGNRR